MALKRKPVFWDKIDGIFMLSKGIVEGRGEDSYYCGYKENSALVGVFDGCGGLGAQTYASFRSHTGAYLASRIVGGAVREWYQSYDGDWNGKENLKSLSEYINKAYEIGGRYAKSNLKLRGSMVRDLPTTLALALIQDAEEGEVLHVVWAGDSRVYLLGAVGLMQLTRDDTDSESAFENLSNDGVLTNVLSSDGNYSLHYKRVELKAPCMVMAMTDGCFGYLPTPMELEYALEESLLQAESLDDWKEKLRSLFDEYAGDDYSFGFAGFGYGTFSGMQESMSSRCAHMKSEYVEALHAKAGDREGRDVLATELWEKYRKEYEQFLN